MEDQENLGSESMEDTIRDALRGQEESIETEENTEEQVIEEPIEEDLSDASSELPVAEEKQIEADPNDKAPSAWKPEVALEWKSLPPGIKAEIQRREQDFHNGIKTYKDAASFGGEIAKECQPYEAVLRHHGFTPASVMRDSMSMLYTLSAGTQEQKQKVLTTIAEQYGVQLPQPGQQPHQTQVDPVIAGLQQKFESMEQYFTRQQQEAQQRQIHEATTEIEKFGSDPTRAEFFPVVRQHMGALIASGQASDLADAYDKAIWANPVTRAKLQSQQIEADRKAAAEKAKEAKRAGSNVKPKGTLPAAKATGSMDDTIREELRRLNG